MFVFSSSSNATPITGPLARTRHRVSGRARRMTHALGLVTLALGTLSSLAADNGLQIFVNEVQPILASHCLDCHGPKTQKSGLRLDSPRAIARGGDSGEPVFLPGDSEASHLIRLVKGTDPAAVMPYEGDRLLAEEIEVLQRWIDAGAALPGVSQSGEAEIETDHWSFQPVHRPKPPEIRDAEGRLLEPIDAFVWAKREEQGLKVAPPAERYLLLRRLHLLALGLPPTPSVVQDFVEDTSPDAYARQVEAVLESPRYGERWGRHWLDVARYADTNGFETNRERKTAYHYRDYVIRSFNEDKPYDQFIREQIAGDAMGADVATGFLVAGPYDIVKSPDINLTLMQRQDELADMVNTTGTAFLGLTLGCARCHNHKFDPILQKDYYAMQAVFAGVDYGERPLARTPDPANQERMAEIQSRLVQVTADLETLKEKAAPGGKSPSRLRPPVSPRENAESFPAREVRFLRFTIHATHGGGEPCLDEWEVFGEDGTNVALEAEPRASGTYSGNPAHRLAHINDGRGGNAYSWISNTPGTGWVELAFAEPQEVVRMAWARDRDGAFTDRVPVDYEITGSPDGHTWAVLASSADRRPYQGIEDPEAFLQFLSSDDALRAGKLLEQKMALAEEKRTLEEGSSAWLAHFRQPEVTHRLYRGDPMQPREEVAPDALTVTGSLDMDLQEEEQQRRLKLAQWIASKDNPLTARVMVNRLWHYLFGTGLVETPSDLGVNGARPTHPELLDWLAAEFMDSGWSLKHMQRLLLTSRTFQQSSRPRTQAVARDADARFLWRFPPRRLEAEAIRDSILAVSGALDLTAGGPGFYLHRVQVENVMHYFPKEEFGPPEFRRMVYLFKIRQEQDGVFGAFDCPDGNQVIPSRSRSNTPLQALNLFNSQFVMQQASILKERLQEEGGPETRGQIDRAFQLFYGRSPDALEMEMSADMIGVHGLEAFCRALFNTSEFLFVF